MLPGVGVPLLPGSDGPRELPSPPSRRKPPCSFMEVLTKFWQPVAVTDALGIWAGSGLSLVGCG